MYKDDKINDTIADVTHEYEGEDDKEEAQYEAYLTWLNENGLEHEQIEEVLDKYIRENSSFYSSDGESQPLLSDKFTANGYEYYDGNYAKDEMINGKKVHKLFYLIGDLHYFSIGDESGDSVTYFYGQNYAGKNTCKYNFTSGSVTEGSSCSSEELQKIEEVKEIFESEIQKLGITIEQLKSNN